MSISKRVTWKRQNWLRVLAIALFVLAVGVIIWQIPQFRYDRFHKKEISLFPSYIIAVAALIVLCINMDIKHKRMIFAVALMAYFILYILMRSWLPWEFIPFPVSLLIISIVIGIIHFLYEYFLMKNKIIRSVLTASQIALFFSAYSLFYYGQFNGVFIWNNLPGYIKTALPLVCVSAIAMTPEICGIIALWLIKKKRFVTSGIVGLIAILSVIELFIVRTKFIHEISYDFSSFRFLEPGSYGLPIDHNDNSLEFKNSLNIIDSLTILSQHTSEESQKMILVNKPYFKLYPYEVYYQWYTEHVSHYPAQDLYNERLLKLDFNIDSDNDGLGDFYEATLLTDAYNSDTDGDGFLDNEDSDPRQPYKDTEYAYVNAAIYDYLYTLRDMYLYDTLTHSITSILDGDTTVFEGINLPFLVIRDEFSQGHGETANFRGQVLILDEIDIYMWSDIFKEVFKYDVPQYICLGFHAFSVSEQYAVVRVGTHAYWGGSENSFLLLKFFGKWCVIAYVGLSVWLD